MTQEAVSQQARPPGRGRLQLGPAAVTVAVVLLLVVGAVAGIGATAVAKALRTPSLTDLAAGVWTCGRTGDGLQETGKVFIGRGSWAVIETDDPTFREGGTWNLTNGRLEIKSSESVTTIEEMPEDLGRNKALRVKQAGIPERGGDPAPRSQDGSVAYANGVLTLRWQAFTFRCTKDR